LVTLSVDSSAALGVFYYFICAATLGDSANAGKVYIDKSAITDQLVEEIYRPSCDPGAAEVFAQCLALPGRKS